MPVAGSQTLIQYTGAVQLGIPYLGLTCSGRRLCLLGRCGPPANITTSAAISLLAELAGGSAGRACLKCLRLTLQPQCC